MECIKVIHISCVVLSFCGFFMRGIWMLSDSKLWQKKWVKIFPHVIDSILLVSALLMLFVFNWSIFEEEWLQVKIGLLLIYIVLGMFALKKGRTKRVRFGAWIAGMMVFLFIVSVALSKSIFGVFSYLFVFD